MRFVPLLVITSLTFFTRAVPMWAQDQALPRFEDQVVVTPVRGESTLDRIPAFVTVIDEEDIAASSAQDVPELLRQSGVHVVDVTGNRRSYRVDVRGFGATAGLNTLVLVDGRRVNQPDLSGTDWAQIPLERVSRIEIVRGSGAAVLFGDNATNGVVNIITKSGGDARTQVSLLAGSFESFTPTVSTQGTAGRVRYSASGRYNRSDGHRDNSATEGGDIGGDMQVTLNDRFRVDFSTAYHGDTTGLPGALRSSDLSGGVPLDGTTHPDDFAEVDDVYAMITPRMSFGPRGYALVDISVRERDSEFFSSFPGGSFTSQTGLGTVAVSPRVVFEQAMGRTMHNIVAGADLSTSNEDITFSGFTDVFELSRTSRGMFVQDEWRAGRTSVTGGYRYEGADYTFAPSDPSEADYGEHAASGGVTFSVSNQAAVFGRVSRSFRTPVLDEMFDFFGRTINTALVPQRSIDVEGGVRIESGPARASVNIFRLSTDDEIFFNPVGGFGFGANENLDGTSLRTGVELAASTIAYRIEFGGTYTFTHSDVDGGAYDGEEVPGVPGHRLTVYGRIPLPSQFSLGIETRYVGERRFEGDFSGAYPDQDSYLVVDSKVTYRRNGVRLFVDLKNLFDEEYSEYGVLASFPDETAFYPSPGFHALFGVDFGF